MDNMYKRMNKYGITEYNFTMNVGLIQGLNSLDMVKKQQVMK